MNYRVLGVKNHQMLSFSKTFATMQPGENMFWPGCAMLSYGKELNMKVYKLLKTAIPDLTVSTFCCGHPSMHIDGGKDFRKRVDEIKTALDENGVKTIYTLCPNCYVTLSDYSQVQVKSVWSILDNLTASEPLLGLAGRSFMLHDPCPINRDLVAADHVRSILKKRGATIVEFDRNREKTMCCGKKNMIMALEPSKGQKIFNVRASQVRADEVVSYCAACVDTFKDNGFQAYHLLELMFESPGKTSWLNRYLAVNGFRKV
jgi:Fe-S oxidoreductase